MSAHDPVYTSHGSMGEVVETGLTKRELFAAMAMQGLSANPDPQVSSWGGQQTAQCAVAFADALLAALDTE